MIRRISIGLAAAFLAGPALAADYVSIVQEVDVARPAEVVWKKVGGFCDIGAWMNTTCEITAGKDGEVGAARRIAGRIDEVLVARTPWSYTYIQPKSPIEYHGTVEVRPAADGQSSKIVYSLFYDAESLGDAAARAADRQRRAGMFQRVLATMKGIAEKD